MERWTMVPVESSNIKAVGHLEGEKLLRIEFMSGGKADYYPVSKEEYEALIASPSKGRHFANRIKAHKLHIPVDETVAEGTSTVSVRNPTEKSLRYDENKPRLEQTRERIQDHFREVTKALREKN